MQNYNIIPYLDKSHHGECLNNTKFYIKDGGGVSKFLYTNCKIIVTGV